MLARIAFGTDHGVEPEPQGLEDTAAEDDLQVLARVWMALVTRA